MKPERPEHPSDERPVIPPFPIPDPRVPDRDDRHRYTPYIALDHDDPVSPTGVFYLSPDIWVVSSLGKNLPKEGEANQIYARVHNLGLADAVNVNVRFFWADPSAAITDASVQPIGGSLAAATQAGVFIPAPASPGGDSTVVVPCPSPWFPIHLGHECLIVKAGSPGFDLATPPYEPVLDPINDRHSAQHNVDVQLLPPGSQFQLAIGIGNISRFAQVTRVQVRALDFARVSRTVEMLGIPLANGLLETPRSMPLQARLSEEASFFRESSGAFARLLLAADEAESRDKPSGARGRAHVIAELSAQLAPWERRQVLLSGTVPKEARPGQAFGFDVTQSLGDLVTGGYVSLIVVARR